MSRFNLLMSLSLVALLAACSDDSTPTPDTGSGKKDAGGADQAVSKSEAGADKAVPDLATGGDAAAACDLKAMAKEAETKGKKILKGVSLKTITSIADIKANTSKYTDKIVRVEGIVVEACPMEGCYATLRDSKGNKLNLKVTDGTVDFRKYAKPGNYATGEGTFKPTGSHGAQVYIEKHGAVIGNMVCSY